MCLREASDHLAHGELADRLKGAIDRERAGPCAAAGGAVVLSSSPKERECWDVMEEEEGKAEGVASPTLKILQVQKCDQGLYRCRVTYKGCFVVSEPARLTVLEDGKTHGVFSTSDTHLYTQISLSVFSSTHTPKLIFCAYRIALVIVDRGMSHRLIR